MRLFWPLIRAEDMRLCTWHMTICNLFQSHTYLGILQLRSELVNFGLSLPHILERNSNARVNLLNVPNLRIYNVINHLAVEEYRASHTFRGSIHMPSICESLHLVILVSSHAYTQYIVHMLLQTHVHACIVSEYMHTQTIQVCFGVYMCKYTCIHVHSAIRAADTYLSRCVDAQAKQAWLSSVLYRLSNTCLFSASRYFLRMSTPSCSTIKVRSWICFSPGRE